MFIVLVVVAVAYVMLNIRGIGQKDYIPGIGPYKLMSVLSGSMSPTFNAGDVIVGKIVNPDVLNQGDIVTFRFGNSLTTHRIASVIKEEGKLSFKTKGDNNNTEDLESVSEQKIVSRYIFRIPLLGFVVAYMKGPIGLIIIWALVIFIILKDIYRVHFKRNKTI